MNLACGAHGRKISNDNNPNASRRRCAPLEVTFSCLTVWRHVPRIRHNTPAMPLYDAHFGGFFVFEACR